MKGKSPINRARFTAASTARCCLAVRPVRIYKLLEKVHVFVVDVPDVILCKNVCHTIVFEFTTYYVLSTTNCSKRYIVGINVVFRVLDTGSAGHRRLVGGTRIVLLATASAA